MNWNNDDEMVGGVVRLGTVKVAAFLIFVLAALFASTAFVHAEVMENSTTFVMGETTISPTPIPTNLEVGRRIDQGACVMPGETIDIAGIGWYTGRLVWYGRYYDGYGGAGNSSVEAIYDVTTAELDHFYLKPDFFNDHLGWWYAVDPMHDTGDTRGNDRIFKVSTFCNLTPVQQQQIIQESINESYKREMEMLNRSKMPEKTIPKISAIISRNLSTALPSPENSHIWIFGEDSKGKYYDITPKHDGLVEFSTSMVNDLNAAEYSVIFVHPGKNTITEEIYDSDHDTLSSPFRNVYDMNLTGIQPMLVRDRLLGRIATSRDDTFTEWKVALQDPDIQVVKFWQDPLNNNHSYISMAGYTNANPGEIIYIQLDADRVNAVTKPKTSWQTEVVDNGGAVAYRTFNATFIVDFNNVFPGQHSMTLTTNNGASATIPIYVRQELPAHYQPPQYLEFIDNSPFIPTPTPEVIIKTVPGPEVTRIVTVTITPSEQQIQKAGEAVATVWIIVGIILLVILAVVVAGLLWMRSVYRRTKI